MTRAGDSESEPASWRRFSTTRPDGCAFGCSYNGKHVLYETKVTCPISATSASGSARQGKAGMQCAFGNSDKYYMTKILGTPLGEGKLPADGDYLMAITHGHTTVPLIHEVFGGLAPRANETLKDLGRRKQGRLARLGVRVMDGALLRRVLRPAHLSRHRDRRVG